MANKLIKFYDTPSGRCKMVDVFSKADVSPGASNKGLIPAGEPKWQILNLRITDGGNDRYHLQLDRETAQKVVDAFTRYLAETVGKS